MSLGVTTGAVRLLLRLEGGVVLAAAIGAYDFLGGGSRMFVLLLLVPDLSIAAYFFGRKAGAFAYNAIHSYLGPALLVAAAWRLDASPTFLLIAAIWAAHIGLDRLLGFGLKYPVGFDFTHLGAPATSRFARRESADDIAGDASALERR
ncbi:hypothetical protein A8B73_16700 [Methylosinus sp. 3S-1]|nr:hypothetical protein A8B73_16700 [Methylosinus sp. 3S-1]